MKLEIFETFLKLVEFRNFSQVAHELGLTQPGITKQIQLLESELGSQLLIRSRAQVALTEAGEKFYRKIRPLYQELQQLLDDTRSASEELKGELRIGSLREVGQSILVPRLQPLIRNNPHLNFMIDFSTSEEIVSRVKSGTLSMGIIAREINEEGVRCYAWENETCVLISHAKNVNIDLERWAKEEKSLPCITHGKSDPLFDLFSHQIRKQRGLSKLRLESHLSVNSHQSILECLLNSHYFAVVPKHVAHTLLEKGSVRQVSEVEIRNPLYLIYLEQNYLPRKVQLVVDHLRKGLQERHL